MPEFTDDELGMFADEMSDGEFADLLLIDMEMTRGGEVDVPDLSARQIREVRAATHAAVYAFGKDVQVAPNVRIGNFGQQL